MTGAEDLEELRRIDVVAWARDILGDGRVVAHLEGLVPRDPIGVPDTARVPWTNLDHSTWPHGGGGQELYLRRDIERTARETLARDAPELFPLPPGFDVVKTLRAAVAGPLRTYFSTDALADARLYVEHAAEGWRRAEKEALEEGPLDRSRWGTYSGGGSDYKRRAAVAAEILFWSTAHGWERGLLAVNARHRLYDGLLLDKAARWPRDARLDETIIRERFHVPEPKPLHRSSPAEFARVARHPVGATDFDPQRAMELADLIRGAKEPERTLTAQRYVEERLAYAESDPPASLELFLADVSVELDLVYSHNEELLAGLRSVKRLDEESGRGAGYLLFESRNDALFDMNERGAYASAFTKFLDGIARLQVRRESMSDKEFLETYQQYWLAVAGLCTKVIESHLRAERPSRAGSALPRYVEFGLLAARFAEESLLALEPHLEAQRHVDGHISSKAWRVHTRLTCLRMLLGVHTLVESGLAESDVTQQGGPACSANLRRAYSAVVTTVELGPTNRNYILQLAIWLAILEGGYLPALRDNSPALVRGSDDDPFPVLITRDPAEMDALQPTSLPFPITRASEWLSERGETPSTLATMPPKGPVARLCRERWGELDFTHWLDRFRPRPEKPSKKPSDFKKAAERVR